MTHDAPLLDWILAVEAVPERGGPVVREANSAERERLREALSLLSLSSLRFEGRVDRLAGGRYRLTGKVSAALEQASVVTLEPVAARLDEPLDIEFRPDALSTAPKDIEVELDEASDIEPIVNGRLEVGRVVYETLSAGLDPYPRKDAEAFDELSAAPKGADTSKDNPFAVLSKLKPKG